MTGARSLLAILVAAALLGGGILLGRSLSPPSRTSSVGVPTPDPTASQGVTLRVRLLSGMYTSRMDNCAGVGPWSGVALGNQLLLREASTHGVIDAKNLDVGTVAPDASCRWTVAAKVPTRVDLVEVAFSGAAPGQPIFLKRAALLTGISLNFIFGVGQEPGGLGGRREKRH